MRKKAQGTAPFCLETFVTILNPEMTKDVWSFQASHCDEVVAIIELSYEHKFLD